MEVDGGRQQAEHRNSSFWKDAGKRLGLGRGPGAAAWHGEVGVGCAEQGTAGTRAASWQAGEGKLHAAYVEPPALARRLKWLGVFFPHSHH